MRGVLVAGGVAVLAYGGWLLMSTQDLAEVRAVVAWAAVGVVLHDAVLAPLVVLLGWLALAVRRRVRGRGARVAAGAAVVLVLLGPVALAAVPVLGRFGAEPSNPTLLGRNYPAGLLVVAGVAVVAATVLAATGIVSEEGRGRRTRGPRPRR